MSFLTLFITIFLFQPIGIIAQKTVNTQNGLIFGSPSADEPSVIEYFGIPYAEPPTNDLRFMPPRPKLPWNNTFNLPPSVKFICLQDKDKLDQYWNSLAYKTTNEELTELQMSEDCLYLNIYAPINATDELFPVMFFIHGGQFSFGSGNYFSGINLVAMYDVIVVTINYRLGALGFAATTDVEGISGNLGLLDQQLALTWIRDNIEVFGGNPNSITLFGESEGASSIHLHMAAPSSKGLFQNAIIQSASYDDQLWNMEQATDNFRLFIDEVYKNSTHQISLKDLQDIDSTLILNASSELKWHPVTAKNFVDRSTRVIMTSDDYTTDVNVLVGSNNLASLNLVMSTFDESQENWALKTTLDVANLAFSLIYPNISDQHASKLQQCYKLYYDGYNSTQSLLLWNEKLVEEIYTDQLYTTWALEISSMQADKNGDVYLYQFQNNGTGDSAPIWAYGAGLGSELPYIFGFMINDQQNESIFLSNTMMNYWTNFAKTGNPNGETGEWIRFTSTGESCKSMHTIDYRMNLLELSNLQKLETSRSWEFWETYYDLIGFSCSDSPTSIEVVSDKDNAGCDDGVWSDAGNCNRTIQETIYIFHEINYRNFFNITSVEMSNETAGILLIVFICLTALFLILFLVCWYQTQTAKKKIKKLTVNDESSSTYSNSYM